MQPGARRHSIRCPRCDGDTRVVDSRSAPEQHTRRRRKCLTCGHRISTVEILDNEYDELLEARRTLRRLRGDLYPSLSRV